MSTKESKPMEVRNDADLQAIQTSVAFKNISDAVEQYRRQFGLAFLALIAFSAIHVGLVVIANLYTMQTRIVGQTMTVAGDEAATVGTAQVIERRSLSYVMTNLAEEDQITSLRSMKSVSFVDREDNFRQYTVTGFQLGGWKRSELKLYTSVGHVLEYVRGKGVRVYSEDSTAACNSTGSDSRKLLQKPGAWNLSAPPPSPPPPPYSSIAEQMIIDCEVVARLNGEKGGCNPDTWQDNMVASKFTGIDVAAGATGSWAHNKALYDQLEWIGELTRTNDENSIYNGAEVQVTMDVVTGETSFVGWDERASGSAKYDGMVTNGAASTLFGNDNKRAVSDKVTSNLGALKNFAGGLSDFATDTMANNCGTWGGEMDCNHSSLMSDVADHLATDRDLQLISDDPDAITTMFEWNAGYSNTHQTLPGLKIMYNYGKGAEVFNDDDQVAKASEGMDRSYWTGAEADFETFNNAIADESGRMFDTYVASDDRDVAVFVGAQEKAFAAAQSDAVWGETIWGADLASAYNAGYPKTADLSYNDILTGSKAQMITAGVLDAVGDFAKATEVIEDIWGNYKAGYSGQSYWGAAGSNDNLDKSARVWGKLSSLCAWGSGSCDGAQYGCSGSGINDLTAFDSPIFYWAYKKCKVTHGSAAEKAVDGVSNALGGVFFSSTLGGYESYAVYLPPKFCAIVASGDLSNAGNAMGLPGNHMEFVFMLHGWGGHCDFIDGLAMVMDDVFSECSESQLTAQPPQCMNMHPGRSGDTVAAAMNGFVVFAPEDGSTPYGTKTWYQDNEFTGLHQTFLQVELLNTASGLLQLAMRTIGLFGFSQGGVGSILMSLGSSAYSGIASFNGPLMPADCFFKNECHQECGVDFIMCELLWSSVLVGMLPYVTVKVNYLMHSTGTTDPMDQGTCKLLKDNNSAKCLKGTLNGSANTLLMWQYVFYKFLSGPTLVWRRKGGPFRYCPSWRAQMAGNQCNIGNYGGLYFHTFSNDYYFPEYFGPNSASSYYYLDPMYFGMAVQHFIPTHNIMTNAAYPQSFQKFLGRTPFFRLWEQPAAYTASGIALSLLVSVDMNDEFGLLKTTQAFSWMLSCTGSILTEFDGVWAYDNPDKLQAGGHVYNYHDTILTVQWFSEVFRSFSAPPTNGFSADMKNLYINVGIPVPAFDEFGLSSSLELMTNMDYSTCFLWELNTGITGQHDGEYLTSKISKVVDECTLENADRGLTGKSMLHPASDITLNDDEMELIEDSNDHAGLHADLEKFEERHENSQDTDVYSCYLATSASELWSGGGGTDSFITKVFDCNMFMYKHGSNGNTFRDGADAAGMACAFSRSFPINYSQIASGLNQKGRDAAYEECSGAFPLM